MNTLDLIKYRRSLRSFSDKKIDEKTIKQLKEATIQAPSAGAMQLYSILEITDQTEKEELAILCDNQQMIAKAPLVWIYLADSQKWGNYYKESGAVARGEEQNIKYRNFGLGDMHLDIQDAVIAAQTTVIAAEALGLGSCYIGDIIENDDKIRPLLNLKQHTIIACMLIIGYPKNENRNLTPSLRCPITSAFMENSYKEPHLKDLEVAYGEMEENLRKQNRLPYDNKGTIADYYYLRKHSTKYRDNMNSSAENFIKNWK